MAIDALNLAGNISRITPAKTVFGSVNFILIMIRDPITNEVDYVEVGLAYVDVYTALERGLDGKLLNELNDSVCEAIGQLTTTVAEVQRRIIEKG